MDVNHFKVINDNFGHESGNHVLVNLVRVLKQTIIEQQTVVGTHNIARLGEEEFGILLNDNNVERMRGLAKSLRQSVEAF